MLSITVVNHVSRDFRKIVILGLQKFFSPKGLFVNTDHTFGGSGLILAIYILHNGKKPCFSGFSGKRSFWVSKLFFCPKGLFANTDETF